MKAYKHFSLHDKLHTDHLEEKYGKTKVDIVVHNQDYRVAHLRDKNKVSRTIAVTLFEDQDEHKDIKSIDSRIKSGGSIGKEFRNQGYAIRKNVVDVYTIPLNKKMQKEFQTTEKYAKARLSEFIADKKGQAPLVYGTVLEVYHPDFRPAKVNEVDKAQINYPLQSLKRKNIPREDVVAELEQDRVYPGKKRKTPSKHRQTIQEIINKEIS